MRTRALRNYGVVKVAANTTQLKLFPYNVCRMDKARIAELLQPFLAGAQPPSETLLDHISTYIDLLVRWNARVNLTAIRDPEQIVTRHFGESLFAACHLFPQQKNTFEGAPPLSRSLRQGGIIRPAASSRTRAFSPARGGISRALKLD